MGHPSIEFSPPVARLFQVLTGEQAGSTREGRLRDFADLVDDLAAGMRAAEPLLATGVRRVRQGVQGGTHDAFLASMERLLGPDGLLEAAADQLHEIGGELRKTSTDVQYAKLMIIAILVELLIEIAIAAAFAFFNPLAAMEWLAARSTVARFFIKTVLGRILLAIAMSQIVGVGLNVVMDAIVQHIQISEGWRDGFDSKSLQTSAAGGSLGAALGLVLGGVGGAVIGHNGWFRKFLVDAIAEGGSEVLTEGILNYVETGEFKVEWANATAGVTSAGATALGEGIGGSLRPQGDGAGDGDSSATAPGTGDGGRSATPPGPGGGDSFATAPDPGGGDRSVTTHGPQTLLAGSPLPPPSRTRDTGDRTGGEGPGRTPPSGAGTTPHTDRPTPIRDTWPATAPPPSGSSSTPSPEPSPERPPQPSLGQSPSVDTALSQPEPSPGSQQHDPALVPQPEAGPEQGSPAVTQPEVGSEQGSPAVTQPETGPEPESFPVPDPEPEPRAEQPESHPGLPSGPDSNPEPDLAPGPPPVPETHQPDPQSTGSPTVDPPGPEQAQALGEGQDGTDPVPARDEPAPGPPQPHQDQPSAGQSATGTPDESQAGQAQPGAGQQPDLVDDADEPSPLGLVIAALRHDGLGELLGRLGPRSALIIRARFGLDDDGMRKSLAEIADRLGLPLERVRRLEAAALNQLRVALAPMTTADPRRGSGTAGRVAHPVSTGDAVNRGPRAVEPARAAILDRHAGVADGVGTGTSSSAVAHSVQPAGIGDGPAPEPVRQPASTTAAQARGSMPAVAAPPPAPPASLVTADDGDSDSTLSDPFADPDSDADSVSSDPFADPDTDGSVVSDPFADPVAAATAPAPVVPVGSVADLASRLPGMSADERAPALEFLSPADRELLASDEALVDALRGGLSATEFAQTAAQLMVQIPAGVEQPVSARHEVQAQIARMLGDPEVAARLLKGGSRVVVVPKDEAMTALAPFRHLAGEALSESRGASRRWDDVRGSGGRTVAVTEENLLGDRTSVGLSPNYVEGYSTTTHEFAHAIHQYGLTAADRKVITDSYQDKLAKGRGVQWPDGPLFNTANQPMHNYSSTNELEYFAQVTNAYLGTNTGVDQYTGQPRNNGAAWVRQHEPALLSILERLYGPDPQAMHAGQANPVGRTQAEHDLYDGYRAFWDQIENTHRPQPHTPAPATPAPTAPNVTTTPDSAAQSTAVSGVRPTTTSTGQASALQHSAPLPPPPDPAVVTKEGGAGLHRSKTTPEGVVVKRRGLTDAGFETRVPREHVVYLDTSRQVPPYAWAEYPSDGQSHTGYIRESNVARDRIGDTGLHFRPTGPRRYAIYDGETRQTVPNGQSVNDTGRDYLRRVMQTLDDAETTGRFRISGRRELVESILADPKQLVRRDLGPWASVRQNVGVQLPRRLASDRQTLIDQGLITEDHQLSEVRFSGSDFHKGGQQVLFLTFTDPGSEPDGARRTVVYKPSSLLVDAELFGTQASVARTLDPDGRHIPTYTIVPITADDGSDAGYGYMEFVPSGNPETAEDLLDVYESLGANMALSYLVGLEDVHQENVLMLKDRVQVIDMEATTGIFKGFDKQLWPKALSEKIQKQLVQRALGGSLTSVPTEAQVQAAALRGFAAALERANDQAAVRQHADRLAAKRARFVPIATADLQNLIFVVHEREYTFQQWTQRLAAEHAERAERGQASSGALAQQALGQTGSSLSVMEALLGSRATFDALLRGDIPYFTRELGSDKVFDEAGTRVLNPVKPETRLDHPKIGESIRVAMPARAQQEARNNALAVFDNNAVKWIIDINAAVTRAINPHALLAPVGDVRLGSSIAPGQPVTADGKSWRLYVSDGLDGEGYDVLNDVVPFDGIAVVPDALGGGGLSTGMQHGAPQPMTIARDDLSTQVWEAVEAEKLDNGWDEVDVDQLDEADLDKLVEILRTHHQDALADSIEHGTESAEDDGGPSLAQLVEGVQLLPAATSVSGGPPQPLLQIWEQDYGGREREYGGSAGSVREQLVADPLVGALFADPQVFLDVIGWDVLSRAAGDNDVVGVTLAIFGQGMVTVHTRFPYGMQDLTFTYRATGGEHVRVVEVYLHRIRKEETAPRHLLIGLVEQQARGIAALGSRVDYRATAIKSDVGYGYNVFPKMGFDADVPDKHLLAMLKEPDPSWQRGVQWLRQWLAENDTADRRLQFSDMFTVTDRATYRQLAELWRIHGDTVELFFDTEGGSASHRALAHYRSLRVGTAPPAPFHIDPTQPLPVPGPEQAQALGEGQDGTDPMPARNEPTLGPPLPDQDQPAADRSAPGQPGESQPAQGQLGAGQQSGPPAARHGLDGGPSALPAPRVGRSTVDDPSWVRQAGSAHRTGPSTPSTIEVPGLSSTALGATLLGKPATETTAGPAPASPVVTAQSPDKPPPAATEIATTTPTPTPATHSPILRAIAALPPHTGGSTDCITRLRAVRRDLFGPPRRAADDMTGPEHLRLAEELGATWTDTADAATIAEGLRNAGPGSTAFVLFAHPGGDPGSRQLIRHGAMVHHFGDGTVSWVETQAVPGEAVQPFTESGPLPVGARAVLVRADGKLVPLERRRGTADALVDPAVNTSYGMRGIRSEMPENSGNDGVDRTTVRTSTSALRRRRSEETAELDAGTTQPKRPRTEAEPVNLRLVDHTVAWQRAHAAVVADLTAPDASRATDEHRTAVMVAAMTFKSHNASYVPLDLLSPTPRQVNPYDIHTVDKYYRSQQSSPSMSMAKALTSDGTNPEEDRDRDLAAKLEERGNKTIVQNGTGPQRGAAGLRPSNPSLIGERLSRDTFMQSGNPMMGEIPAVDRPTPDQVDIPRRARQLTDDMEALMLSYPPAEAPAGGPADGRRSYIDHRMDQSRAAARVLTVDLREGLTSIKVSGNERNPNVTIYLEALDKYKFRPNRPSKDRITEWLQVYFAGLVTTLAAQAELPLPLQIRQSFGFLDSTVADTVNSIRFSPGSEPPEFLAVVAEAVRQLDTQLPALLEEINKGRPPLSEKGNWNTVSGDKKYAGWCKAVLATTPGSAGGNPLLDYAKWVVKTKATQLGDYGQYLSDSRTATLDDYRSQARAALHEASRQPATERIQALRDQVVNRSRQYGLPVVDDLDNALVFAGKLLEQYAGLSRPVAFPATAAYALDMLQAAVDSARDTIGALQDGDGTPADRATAHTALRNAAEDLVDASTLLAAALDAHPNRDPAKDNTALVQALLPNGEARVYFTSSGMQAITAALLGSASHHVQVSADRDAYFEVAQNTATTLRGDDTGTTGTGRVSDAAPLNLTLPAPEPSYREGSAQDQRVLDVTTAGDPLAPDLLCEMGALRTGNQRIAVAASLLKYYQLGADHIAQGIIVDLDPSTGPEPPTPTMVPNVRQFLSMLTDLRASNLYEFDPAVHELLPAISAFLFDQPGPETAVETAVAGSVRLLSKLGAAPDDIRALFTESDGSVTFDLIAYFDLLAETLGGIVDPLDGEAPDAGSAMSVDSDWDMGSAAGSPIAEDSDWDMGSDADNDDQGRVWVNYASVDDALQAAGVPVG